MVTKSKEAALNAIFFGCGWHSYSSNQDGGDHYALVGSEVGLTLDARQLDRRVLQGLESDPRRTAIDGPRPDTMTRLVAANSLIWCLISVALH